MTQQLASRLETYLKEKTDGALRSIVRYEHGEYTVVSLRDDVESQYTDEEFETAIDNSRMESLVAPVYDDMFSEDHGELTCLITAFENVAEMNFVLDDDVGVVVAIDSDAFNDAPTIVAGTREILLEEREDT